MTRTDEDSVAGILSREFGLRFQPSKLQLDGWGEADRYSMIGSDRFVVVEVERG